MMVNSDQLKLKTRSVDFGQIYWIILLIIAVLPAELHKHGLMLILPRLVKALVEIPLLEPYRVQLTWKTAYTYALLLCL